MRDCSYQTDFKTTMINSFKLRGFKKDNFNGELVSSKK